MAVAASSLLHHHALVARALLAGEGDHVGARAEAHEVHLLHRGAGAQRPLVQEEAYSLQKLVSPILLNE